MVADRLAQFADLLPARRRVPDCEDHPVEGADLRHRHRSPFGGLWGGRTVELPPVAPPPDWAARLRELFTMMADRQRERREVLRLKSEVDRLSREVEALRGGDRRAGVLVPVQTFAPEPYDVLAPFQVLVAPTGEDFSASLPDANLTAYGDTEYEAVGHLKAMLLDTFDKYTSGRKLGPGPARQLAVLRQFIRKRG